MLQWFIRRLVRLYARLRFGPGWIFSDPQGPIEHLGWGTWVVAGQTHAGGDTIQGAGADIRWLAGGVTAWVDRSGHTLTSAMITGVFDQGIEVLVLGLGIQSAVRCSPEVIAEVQRRGIPEVVTASSPEAARIFNDLCRQGRRVAFLGHGTC